MPTSVNSLSLYALSDLKLVIVKSPEFEEITSRAFPVALQSQVSLVAVASAAYQVVASEASGGVACKIILHGLGWVRRPNV